VVVAGMAPSTETASFARHAPPPFDHPYIAAIHEAGEMTGTLFIVMMAPAQ